MAHVKGTDIVTMRKIIKKKGAEAEQAFLSTLTPEISEMYQYCSVGNMLPVDQAIVLYEKGAQFLFPNDPGAMRKLGSAFAREAYSGIYKVFLRVPTSKALIERTARIWKTYFDKGEASVENNTDTSDDVVVRSFPDCPRNLLEAIAGHLAVLIEFTGGKNVNVEIEANDPQAWRWKISWV